MSDREPDRSRKGRRKVRVDLRRNRGKTTRDQSDLARKFLSEDVQAEDVKLTESVRAKGGLSRKRTIIIREDESGLGELRDGLVVALRGLIAEVDDGRTLWGCTVRRLLRTRTIQERHPIAVGDRVRFRPVAMAGQETVTISDSQALPEGVVEEVAERKTTLTRRYERRIQVVAANIDIAVIVMAVDQPTLRPHLIDRYLVSVHLGDMRPVICINKADLDVDGAAAGVAERYASLGYKSLLTSVVDGSGLDLLREVLSGQTAVLAGPSGAGKSSILNALDPGLNLKVGTLTDLQRGKHTTTTARLLKWAFGGHVVDTPGLRQFDLTEIDPTELEAYFIEFRDLVSQCRFPNCTHTQETECAVRDAVEDGRICPERYESYCRMYEECVEKRKEKYRS